MIDDPDVSEPRIGFAAVPHDCTRDPAVSLKLKAVFAIIVGRVGSSDVYPLTNDTLLHDTGIKSRTTLLKHRAALEAIGWIVTQEGTRRWKGRTQAVTFYSLTEAAIADHMSYFAQVWHPIARDARLSLEARGLYSVIAGHAGKKKTAFLSVRRLEAETGSGADTIARCRRELRQAGVMREGISMRYGCLTFTLGPKQVREDFDPALLWTRTTRPMDAAAKARIAARRAQDRSEAGEQRSGEQPAGTGGA